MSTSATNMAALRTAPSTPMKAISSTLTTKAAPSIPPASQAYEPLVKALFRHRLRSTLLTSAAYSWASCIAWAWFLQGGLGLLGTLSLLLSPWVLVSTVLAWVVVAWPISVLRKVFLTARRSGATSPLSIVKEAFRKDSMKASSIICAASALSALVLHIVSAYHYESDPKLSLFVKSKKHPHYLNGRLLFLIITQCCTSIVYNLRGAMIDRYVYKWDRAFNHRKLSTSAIILTSNLVAITFSVFSVILASVIFSFTRAGLPILYQIPFLSYALRPFTGHFVKGSWTFSILIWNAPLAVRAWFVAYTTLVVWETVNVLFDGVTETAAVSTLSADPDVTLVSGLSSTDRIFQFFAFSELRDLAAESSSSAAARRTTLFGDQQTPLNLWSCLVRQSLLVLEGDYQLFLRRGKPAPIVVDAKPVKPTIIPSPSIATPTPFLRQRVFKNSVESPGQAAMDALASDGPISRAIDFTADITHVPELFRSVEHKVVSPIKEETKKSVQTVTGIGGKCKSRVATFVSKIRDSYLPVPVQKMLDGLWDWMTRQRESRLVEASIPFWEMDITVIEALSFLTSASLTEDRYGVVQRDIPKILETMLAFLGAIEQYQAELSAQSQPLPSTASAKEVEDQKTRLIEITQAQELLGNVGDGLKEGILRITTTFGDSLLAFKFPPKIAGKLQAFLDYS